MAIRREERHPPIEVERRSVHIIRLVGGEPYCRAADEAVAQALNATGYTVGTPGLKKAGGK